MITKLKKRHNKSIKRDTILFQIPFYFLFCFNVRSVFCFNFSSAKIAEKKFTILALISVLFFFFFFCFKLFSVKYWKGFFLFFCFNIRSVLVVLISFLLNIGNEMCYFHFNFCSVFLLISFLLNIRRKCLRKRIYVTTCYINLLEKYVFLMKMPEISCLRAIIWTMIIYIAF